MNIVGNPIDVASTWIGFNLDSFGVFVIVIGLISALSFWMCIVVISATKHRAAIELANYGGSRRPLSSFACKVCLHRTYAKSHIVRRYCARCDKCYPDRPKIWKFPEGVPADMPIQASGFNYNGLEERQASEPRKTSA